MLDFAGEGQMLDFIGTVVTAALMVFVVAALVIYMEISRAAKLTLAAIAGLWIGLAAAASAAGWLAISTPFPVVGVFVATPLIAAAIATAWPAARAALLALPTALLIGLNIGRVFAVLFLLLGMRGQLAGPFPLFAGWGDIITGVFAVPLLFVAADTRYSAIIAAWNLFGIADLVHGNFSGCDVSRGFAAAALLFAARLGSDAASAVVVRSRGLGSILADRSCDHLGATARAKRPRARRSPRDLVN